MRTTLAVLFALAVSCRTAASAQPAPDTFPTDEMLASVVLISIDDEIVGTGVAMADDAQSVVTPVAVLHGRRTGIVVRYQNDGFSRGADLVAVETITGLAVLWAAGGHPPHAIAPAEPRAAPLAGEQALLVGYASSFHDPRYVALVYGNYVVEDGTSFTDAAARMTVAAPHETAAMPSQGMGVFSAVSGRLLGIVVDWRSSNGRSQFVAVPASTVTALLRAIHFQLDKSRIVPSP